MEGYLRTGSVRMEYGRNLRLTLVHDHVHKLGFFSHHFYCPFDPIYIFVTLALSPIWIMYVSFGSSLN